MTKTSIFCSIWWCIGKSHYSKIMHFVHFFCFHSFCPFWRVFLPDLESASKIGQDSTFQTVQIGVFWPIFIAHCALDAECICAAVACMARGIFSRMCLEMRGTCMNMRGIAQKCWKMHEKVDCNGDRHFSVKND